MHIGREGGGLASMGSVHDKAYVVACRSRWGRGGSSQRYRSVSGWWDARWVVGEIFDRINAPSMAARSWPISKVGGLPCMLCSVVGVRGRGCSRVRPSVCLVCASSVLATRLNVMQCNTHV
eukprot:364319-Chlamydomonas_euryale.AAC.9